MAFSFSKLTGRTLPASNVALLVGLSVLVAGIVWFGSQPTTAVIAFVVAWFALAYGSFGRKTLLAELFLTLGWAVLVVFIVFVYNGSERWWIGALVGLVAGVDSFGMLRRRAYRRSETAIDE